MLMSGVRWTSRRPPATATSTVPRSERCCARSGTCSWMKTGIARQGLIIRHLVLPEGTAGSRETLAWIAEHLGTETHIALMNQYFPAHRAVDMKPVSRKVARRGI